MFRRTAYSATVPEDASVGTSVVTVSAVDKDVRPRNSQFTYNIASGDPEGRFVVSGSSGSITVARPLDRETVSVYNLTVHAVDQGVPPAVGSASVIVTLGDINDSPPRLGKISFKSYLKVPMPPDKEPVHAEITEEVTAF